MPALDTTAEKKIKLILNRIHNLPTPPMVFTQVNKVINDPNTSAYQIGAIISEDPALTAKILKLTNSAFYGLPRTITSVKQSIIILGLDVVRSLVLSASVFDTFSKQLKIDREYLDSFWRHSLSVAFMARIISRMKSFPALLEAEESFAAGLLHDIGKLVMLSHLPEEFKQVKKMAGDNPQIPVHKIEDEVVGFDHSLVGSYLAQKWNLPPGLASSILYHHDPDKNADAESLYLTYIVHISNYLSKRSEDIDENSNSKNNHYCSPNAWVKLGIKPDQEEQLVQLLRTEYMKAETFLNMARGD